MKSWQVALVIVVLVGVLAFASSQPKPAVVAPPPSAGNDLFSSIAKLASGALSSSNKPSAPSAVNPAPYQYTPVYNVDPNKGIDPTTGGVNLETDQVYGPPAPSN